MKTLLRVAAPALALSFLSVSSLAFNPETKSENAEQAETPDDKAVNDRVEESEAKAEEKRICRRIRIDVSSRRATKVCKTAEEWRLFNQRR